MPECTKLLHTSQQILVCFHIVMCWNPIQPKQICWCFSVRCDKTLKSRLRSVHSYDLNYHIQPLKKNLGKSDKLAAEHIHIVQACIQQTGMLTKHCFKTHKIKE